MTWLMTICHHMTFVTWHTSYVKAWLMSIKFDIWLLVYVAVSKLERWFYFRFARYLGLEIHFYYRRLGDLHTCIHAWPWNWPLLSLLVFDLSQWFFCCFVRILGQEIHSNYRRSRDLNAWPWNWMSRHVYVTYVIFACICATAKIFLVLQRFWVREFILTIVTCVPFTYDLETQGHVMVYVTFVISGHLYVSYRNDFLFCQVFRSRNSFWLLPIAWPQRVTLKLKVTS